MPYQPIVLRDEELPDATVAVVRGVLATADLRRSATDNRLTYGFFGLSVEMALDADWQTVCRTSRRLGRYGQVRLSDAGRLRRAGFALLATFARPHYDIVLADEADDTVARLLGCFDAPVQRPGALPPEERYPR